MVGLPDGKKTEDIYNRLDSLPACDRRTDRQTDRRTSCDGVVSAMHTRRAVKLRLNGRITYRDKSQGFQMK